MMQKPNKKSLIFLKDVHSDLASVAMLAFELCSIPFQISDGLRTYARQVELYEDGKSKTLRSRHLTGHAIDVFATSEDGKVAYWDMPYYVIIADAFKEAARQLGVSIECGVDWKNFPDGPHIQLSWVDYPAEGDDKHEARTLAAHPDDNPNELRRIMVGDRGDDVRWMQIALREKGFYTHEVDGIFGTLTFDALYDWQKSKGLVADGIFGPISRAKMGMN